MLWTLAQSGDGTPPSWADEFQAYSTFHAVAVSVCIVLIALACSLGRRWRETDRERTLRLAIGWSIILFQVFATVWRVLPEQWDIGQSLPLHMCRLISWLAGIALITGHWRARSLTFFWGLGLSTQGFVTPMWSDGYASVDFWMYWLGHGQIVLAATYDLSVRGYSPRRRDWAFACLAGLAYGLVTIGVNHALGANYAYLGAGEYEASSVVDVLGPYPWRLLSMIGGAGMMFTLLYLAVIVARRWRRRIARWRGRGAEPALETA